MRAPLVYLDHGATSWPKPPEVVAAVDECLRDCGGNPGRGAYKLALDTARAIEKSRGDIAGFLGVRRSSDLLFQPGCTQAMNLVLYGLLGPGDRVVAASMEHNAVARPLNVLAARGADVVVVDTDEAGVVDVDEVERAVRAKPTRAVVCQHASNVTGAVQPVADLADVAHDASALLLVDGAQAGGHLAVDLSALGADAWACSGHKGLLGPQGIGVLYLAEDCEPTELVSGGTGSGASELPTQPTERPDRYEAGTPNTVGIAGLGAAVRFLAAIADEQRALESRLVRRLIEGLNAISGLTVLGPPPDEPRAPLVSVVHERLDSDRIAHELESRFNIAVRSGLHCAPWAHRTLGTLETGAVRFGIGWGTTVDDVELAVEAMEQVARGNF